MKSDGIFDIVVVGGANWDYLVRGSRLPRAGETVMGDQFQEGAGGKGANQACGAARFEARAALVARVGKDRHGELVLSKLGKEGVNCDFVVQDPVLETGIALVMVDWQGEKQILTAPGANAWLTVADVKAAAGAIEGARVLLTQLEVPLDAVREAIELARKFDTRVVLDAAPAVPLSDDLLHLVNVLRANAGEAQVLTGISVHDRDSARRAAHQLLKRGVEAVVIQAGSEGNLVISADAEHWLPKIKVPTVDTTGAGDAFAAALGVMLAMQRTLVEAATFANAAAALKTTVLGAQAGLPQRETVLALIRRQADFG
jgi:ribokinase